MTAEKPSWIRVTDPLELGKVKQEALAYFQARFNESQNLDSPMLAHGPKEVKEAMLREFREHLAVKLALFRMNDTPVYKLAGMKDVHALFNELNAHSEMHKALKNKEAFEVWPSPRDIKPGDTVYAFGAVFERMFGNDRDTSPARG
jgi:hypothetical protein